MLSSNKECEWDPDHLYHDHREVDELRAENERLRAALRTEHFSSNGSSVYMEGPPEHDRSIARCRHPLCIALKFKRTL